MKPASSTNGGIQSYRVDRKRNELNFDSTSRLRNTAAVTRVFSSRSRRHYSIETSFYVSTFYLLFASSGNVRVLIAATM